MKKKLLIAGIIVISIGIAVYLINHFHKKNNEGMLVLSGNVEVTEVDIGFKIPGRIEELLVEEGQKVKKGDKFARLDSEELETYVSQNMAFVKKAEAELYKAKKDYQRYEALYKNRAVSAQQMDTAKKTYDVAVSQLHQTKAGLMTSEVRLKDTTIYSPVSGVILRKNVELGEMVSAGTPVYSLGDLENPWIKVYIKEDKLGLIKLGQTAKVTTDSYPGKVYEGTITYISSEAEFTPKNVQTQEERVKLVFGAKVSVKNINDELKPGMPADVKILLK